VGERGIKGITAFPTWKLQKAPRGEKQVKTNLGAGKSTGLSDEKKTKQKRSFNSKKESIKKTLPHTCKTEKTRRGEETQHNTMWGKKVPIQKSSTDSNQHMGKELRSSGKFSLFLGKTSLLGLGKCRASRELLKTWGKIQKGELGPVLPPKRPGRVRRFISAGGEVYREKKKDDMAERAQSFQKNSYKKDNDCRKTWLGGERKVREYG